MIHRRFAPLALVIRLIAVLSVVLFAGASRASTTVRVLIPDSGNLQYMSFWIAKGAGYFDDEGISIRTVIPDQPSMAKEAFKKRDAEVSVMPPPMYLELIADKVPIVLVANLFQNDPIDLVVRKSVFDERKLSASAPLADRLRGLHGLRVGVAPNPPTRLRALFASQGLDADKDIQMVVIHGKEQNAVFEAGKVDALYAHTPYLEKALVDQGATMLVNQSAGEVPELATRQIHALVFQRSFLESSRSVAVAMTRAIYRAQKLLHADAGAAVAALLHEFPELDRTRLETIVRLYAPAVPETPKVSSDGFQAALRLFPAGHAPPDLSGIDLARHVASDIADEVVAPASPPRETPWRIIGGVALGVGVLAALVMIARRKRTTAS